MRKYIYSIPCFVNSTDINPVSLEIVLTVTAVNQKQAIAIAQDLAKKKFFARFPSRRRETVQVGIDVEKIEVKGSGEFNKNKKKNKRSRERLLPFENKKIKYLPDKVYNLGSQIVKHRVIVFDDWLRLFLLESEKPKIYKDKENDRERLIIVDKRQRYVKVLVRNEEDMPVLMRIEPDFQSSSKKKFKTEIEFLESFGYSPWIPKSEYKEAIKIASKILKGGVK